ncbi:MAG: helix-turn-helix domain-containing protein [Elusimicrobia bacterium]|nr:helix-turn-helix domain-containing protein [Elusimicrobiota bacterium]
MRKQRIKQALKEAGLTQSELARKMKITQPTVNAFVNGRRNPTATTLKKIAKATGKDISYFFSSGGISQSANNSTNIRQTINNADMEFIKDSFQTLQSRLDALEAKLDLLIAIKRKI